MQTFVPFPDFEASARALDTKRLGKQRVEVIQIVRALTVPGYAWSQHPATLMWKGYEEALGRYGLTMCDVWVGLGFDDTCAGTIAADLATFGIAQLRTEAELAEAGALPPAVRPRSTAEPPVVAGPQGAGALPQVLPGRAGRHRVRLAGPLAGSARPRAEEGGERPAASAADRAEDPRRARPCQAQAQRGGQEGGAHPSGQRRGAGPRGCGAPAVAERLSGHGLGGPDEFPLADWSAWVR